MDYTKITTLKISLDNTKCPKVTRTISVHDTCNFKQLHDTIQDAMGWQNEHLYQFYDSNRKPIKATELITDYVYSYKSIKYVYDMGDSWEHTIRVIQTPPSITKCPVLLKGVGACPLENCGGTWGFANLKFALSTGAFKGFDPLHFDIANVNFRHVWNIYGIYKRCRFERY